MEKIGKQISNFSLTKFKEYTSRDIIAKLVSDVVKRKLSPDDVKIYPDRAIINLDSVEKHELRLTKKKIIKKLVELGLGKIKDLR